MFLIRLIFFPIRLAFGVGRFFGFGRLTVFLLGIAIGLLAAPTTGRELRAKLQSLFEQAGDRIGEATS